MFSKVFAAAALAVVSAADVPVFSSNDDYDEINLNIRMLSNHSSADVATPTQVTGSVTTTATFPAGTTVSDLNADTEVKAAMGSWIWSASGATSCTVDSITDGSRRALEATKRQLTVSLTLAIAYTATFASAALATAATWTGGLLSSGNTAFETAFASGMTTNLAAMSTPMVITGATATSSGATVASSGAAATPSPSPSSNAAKVAVSSLAAIAAFVASMF